MGARWPNRLPSGSPLLGICTVLSRLARLGRSETGQEYEADCEDFRDYSVHSIDREKKNKNTCSLYVRCSQPSPGQGRGQREGGREEEEEDGADDDDDDDEEEHDDDLFLLFCLLCFLISLPVSLGEQGPCLGTQVLVSTEKHNESQWCF